ncbi:ABC transporter permease subunit [Candidimonas sp. SYP-B2681]|nr:glycine betaine ABC transporter substrate-binding protein [Candidimonas sp. SYP-B2681]RTZ45328.1 ABC transporter permease subunit [Candidimonas sp. SYP-B2681]
MKQLNVFLGVLAVILAAACPAYAAAQAPCNGGQVIKLADQTWESATFTTHVIRKLLVEGYGCQVEIVPGTPAAVESALAQNDLQVIAEQWSGRSPIIEKAVAQGTVLVVGDTLQGGAQQGWYVPDYLVHGDPARGIKPLAPDLNSWDKLARYKHLFTDPEEPRKGRFLNCPSGWVCEKTNSRLLALRGLEKDYTNFRAGTGAALDAAISSAYDQGKPILFYYWQPAGLMAKYKFHKLEQGPFNKTCWDSIVSGEGTLCPSDFLVARLAVAVSRPFAQNNAQIIEFFNRLTFEPALLNRMILIMTEQRLSGDAAATEFLKEHPKVWHAWMPAEIVANVDATLGNDAGTASHWMFPQWSGAAWINRQVTELVQAYGGAFRRVSDFMLTAILLPVERIMQKIPPWLFLAFVAVLSWHATRKPLATVLYVSGLFAIGLFGLWDKLIQTFSLVLVSTAISVVVGIPIGVIAARLRFLRRLLIPVLDVMQTLPSFVYLIPVLMLFGLGKVPALFATVIYAVPPLIRLTILGLRQVDPNVTEAAQAFGVTRWQMLTKVTLPLARPSIMAGINQTTMMALGMVVVASMIGARGLGEDVLAGIQTLDVGRGLQAGLAIVILAIVMDRITQAYGRPRRHVHAGNDTRNLDA